MHVTYRDLMLARIKTAIGAAKAAGSISHPGMKGEIREILIRDLFRPLLPSFMGVMTGQIISHLNQTSRQQDIVLYDRSILPPLLFENRVGLLPIEAVLCSIEVKSRLTAQEMDSSDKSAGELSSFTYSSGNYSSDGIPSHHQVVSLIPSIFGFESDLASGGMSETDRYDGLRSKGSPSVRNICVVGRGYWYWQNDHWQSCPVSYEFEEVVAFISGIMNRYREVALSRGVPRLGAYLG